MSALAIFALALTPTADLGLPRFTEEREAAALHFIRKHSPDLVPLLDDLEKTQRPRYEQQIREIFQVTELLAELRDQPRRLELELRIWKTENRAFVLVARYPRMSDDEKRQTESRLQDLARELAEFDVQALELQTEELETELTAVKDELGQAREGLDRRTRDRLDAWLEQAQKPKR